MPASPGPVLSFGTILRFPVVAGSDYSGAISFSPLSGAFSVFSGLGS